MKSARLIGLAAERQSGVSLIELMISITISLLVVTALLGLYVNTSQTNAEMARTNRLIDNGNLAMQLMREDIVHAGFWGTHVPEFDDQTFSGIPTDTPATVPNPCLAFGPSWDPLKSSLIGIPIQAYDAAAVCTSVLTNSAANSDVLVVRHADTCVAGIGTCDADVAGKLYFQSSLCDGDAAKWLLDTSGFSLHEKDCVSLSGKRRFISNIYYVRTYAAAMGDGIPVLVRSQFDLSGSTLTHQAPVGLIEGIEALRVELGIDNTSRSGAAVDYGETIAWTDAANLTEPTNRGDGQPDVYVHCTSSTACTAAQLTNVTEVKIYLLARSREPSPGYTDAKTYTLGSAAAPPLVLGPFNDGYKRHVYSTTIRLYNIASRRESQ